ncbi:MAG: TIGR04219 family outer membrane beta-barrel protein [Candidatus Thiodiazotropha sp. (ex Myrtea sp. 'scaly one' KF741663)]|nr:TIGR04219 family outer membrane beta-barrel protein [Candidatus Thiodiazotropha sp. (ex Myrtea sp. 'scaly one' KF741663)]
MMKKTMIALLASACSLTTVQADTVLGVTMSVDAWSMDSSGELADTADLQTFDLGSETPALFSFALEHPVPLIPNFRLKFADLSSKGNNVLSSNFTFNGVTYPLSTAVDVDFDIQSSDFIFYYELLDNDAVSFDLGFNGKYLDGDILISDGSQSARETFKGIVPMLYGAVEFGIPTTRLSLFGDISLLSVGDHTLRDYTAGAAYTLVDNMAVDFSVRGGYRRFSLELDDLDGIYADWSFDGLFLGVEADF